MAVMAAMAVMKVMAGVKVIAVLAESETRLEKWGKMMSKSLWCTFELVQEHDDGAVYRGRAGLGDGGAAEVSDVVVGVGGQGDRSVHRHLARRQVARRGAATSVCVCMWRKGGDWGS